MITHTQQRTSNLTIKCCPYTWQLIPTGASLHKSTLPFLARSTFCLQGSRRELAHPHMQVLARLVTVAEELNKAQAQIELRKILKRHEEAAAGPT